MSIGVQANPRIAYQTVVLNGASEATTYTIPTAIPASIGHSPDITATSGSLYLTLQVILIANRSTKQINIALRQISAVPVTTDFVFFIVPTLTMARCVDIPLTQAGYPTATAPPNLILSLDAAGAWSNSGLLLGYA